MKNSVIFCIDLFLYICQFVSLLSQIITLHSTRKSPATCCPTKPALPVLFSNHCRKIINIFLVFKLQHYLLALKKSKVISPAKKSTNPCTLLMPVKVTE